MVRQHWLILAINLLPGLVLGGEPPLRREADRSFVVDQAFQADGGAQVFFELVGKEDLTSHAGVAAFRELDLSGRWRALKEPVHVALFRLSWTIEKDVTFFTKERLFDLPYVQAIAPEMDVSALPDGGFQVGRTPANRFALTYLEPGAAPVELAALAGADARRGPVLIQVNTDFSRVMGVRTAAFSVTWTFHEALAPGSTRITVLTLTALHNVPPFFLGGEARVFRETCQNAAALMSRLRAYREH